MGEWGWIVFLMVVGAALEASGLVLVILEVRSESEKIDAFVKRPLKVYAATAIFNLSSTGTATISGGRKPTTEERLRLLEDAVNNLANGVQEMEKKLHERWLADMSETENRIEKALSDYKADLEKLVTNAPTKLRLIGVSLFLIGLLLQSAGNVWSMVRSG